jgi:hypothetical protein
VPRNPEIRWNDKRKDLLFGVKRESEAKLVSLWGKRSDTEILHEMQPEEWVVETVWYTLGRGLRWIPTYFPGAGRSGPSINSGSSAAKVFASWDWRCILRDVPTFQRFLRYPRPYQQRKVANVLN